MKCQRSRSSEVIGNVACCFCSGVSSARNFVAAWLIAAIERSAAIIWPIGRHARIAPAARTRIRVDDVIGALLLPSAFCLSAFCLSLLRLRVPGMVFPLGVALQVLAVEIHIAQVAG